MDLIAKGSRVETGGRVRWRHQPADHVNALRLAGNCLCRIPIALHKPWPLDQIARWIAADGELGKHDELGAGAARAPGEVDDLGRISREIPDSGVDLAERNPHVSSVRAQRPSAKLTKLLAACIPAPERPFGLVTQVCDLR